MSGDLAPSHAVTLIQDSPVLQGLMIDLSNLEAMLCRLTAPCKPVLLDGLPS